MATVLPTSVLNELPYTAPETAPVKKDVTNLKDWSISFGSPKKSASKNTDFVETFHAGDDAEEFANSRIAQIMKERGYDPVVLRRMDALVPAEERDNEDVINEEGGSSNKPLPFNEARVGDFDPKKPDIGNRYRVFYEASKIVHDYHNQINSYDDAGKITPMDMAFNMMSSTFNPADPTTKNAGRKEAQARTPEQISKFGVEFGGQLNYNETSIGSAFLKNYPPEVAISIAHILQEYDRLPDFTPDGSIRMIKGIFNSPSTYVGAGSLKAVSGLLNFSSKKAIQRTLANKLMRTAGGASIIGAEGGMYAAMHDVFQQNMKAGGQPYKHNMKQTLLAAGIGFAATGVLTAALPFAVAGAKSVAKSLNQTSEGTVLRTGVGPVPTDTVVPVATDVSEIGFFSSVSRAIDNLPMDKGSSAQMRAMIAKSEGVKPEEMLWTGLDEFLKGRKNVTKAEIKEYMDANQVQIKQVEKNSTGQTGEPENLTWGEAVADDSFEAYGHRVGEIAHDIDRGDDSFVEDVINRLLKDNPKRYPEIDPDGGSSWANKLRDHFDEGGTIYDLDDKMRYDVNDAIDGIAKAEYMDNPYVTVQDDTGRYDIYGNDDVGYQITRQSDGTKINDFEIYSLEEAKIQAYTDGFDYGYIGAQLDEGDTLFSEYTLPGGENYREVLLTLPSSGERKATQAELDKGYASNNQGAAVGVDDAGMVPDVANDFRSGHFNEPNVLAHIRLNDRTGPNGEKILFVEEVQSDWHQKGRKQGYKKETSNLDKELDFVESQLDELTPKSKANLDHIVAGGDRSNLPFPNIGRDIENFIDRRSELVSEMAKFRDGVPDAPLKKNWHEMAMRRVIRMASEEGYDSIAWTPGKMQTDRYPGMPEERKPGLRDRYDKMIKNYVSKFGKKFDTKVGVTKIGDGDEVWNLRITKKMRDSVMKKGVPLFGAGALAAGADRDNNQPAL